MSKEVTVGYKEFRKMEDELISNRKILAEHISGLSSVCLREVCNPSLSSFEISLRLNMEQFSLKIFTNEEAIISLGKEFSERIGEANGIIASLHNQILSLENRVNILSTIPEKKSFFSKFF